MDDDRARDQLFLDPLANSPLKIWEVQTRVSSGWEPKLRLTSTEEQVIESMETLLLLLGRSGTGKTICIANKMRADRRVAPGTSQLYISIRQHTSAYVSIRQHTSAYVSIG